MTASLTLAWPSEREVDSLFRREHGDPDQYGWRVRMRHRFGYFPSERWYESVVDQLVHPGTAWIDVGGGKAVFPHNPKLSRALADRCGLLVGVDPSPGIHENPFVHERFQSGIEDFRNERRFDLATLRMVAEHVEDPQAVVKSLAALVRPGGHVVIYTPHRWSPVSIAASLIPNRSHSFFTHLLWKTDDSDVFPTHYRMNTRGRLRSLFEGNGFREAAFARLPNCTVMQRFRATYAAELFAWRALRACGLGYPESDLLGVYRRSANPTGVLTSNFS